MTRTMRSMVINDVPTRSCRARRRVETVFPVDSGHGGVPVLLVRTGLPLGYKYNSEQFPTDSQSAQHITARILRYLKNCAVSTRN